VLAAYKPQLCPIFAVPFREVSEWSKEHAWKVCMAQKVIVGSNPILSAKSPVFNKKTGLLLFQIMSFKLTCTQPYFNGIQLAKT
jgi:hypothetical protein